MYVFIARTRGEIFIRRARLCVCTCITKRWSLQVMCQDTEELQKKEFYRNRYEINLSWNKRWLFMVPSVTDVPIASSRTP